MALQLWRHAMQHYMGLDVSLKQTGNRFRQQKGFRQRRNRIAPIILSDLWKQEPCEKLVLAVRCPSPFNSGLQAAP
jgi:hypothetical protein